MTIAKTPKLPETEFRLPEPEKTQDEKMTASRHLSLTGGTHYLTKHLGKLETTVVGSDLYLAPVSPAQLQSMSGVPYPDLFVAFDADPAGYLARNGYVISEQGKPPDFATRDSLTLHRTPGHSRQAHFLRRPGHPGIRNKGGDPTAFKQRSGCYRMPWDRH